MFRPEERVAMGIFVAAFLALAATAAWAGPVTVETKPVPLNAAEPGQRTVAGLRYRGGLELTSPDRRFGGFSGLAVSVSGERILAVSDRGLQFEAHLAYDEKGDLVGLGRARLDALAGPDGSPLLARDENDAEALSPGATGELIVAFERRHRLWRYLPGRALPEPLPAPAELKGAPPNGGIEALTLLADGRLLAIAENFGTRTSTVGWVSDREGWSVLTYAKEDDFRPTGATTLPGGDVVVVERFFGLRGGSAARLRRIPGGDIEPGAELKGKRIAELAPPLTQDNFEGVAARQGTHGETLIYLISDDNFNPDQRTLLMMFEISD